MATQIVVRDASASGKTLDQWPLELPAERITIRELIRSRVYQEVQDFNLRGTTGDERALAERLAEYRGLVRPADPAASDLAKPRSLVDWKRQFDVACEAFQQGRILILIDDRQANGLDEVVELRSGATVSFLRLTLLVGG